jgi:ribosomal protein S18 acetylase RimI-like enzyme
MLVARIAAPTDIDPLVPMIRELFASEGISYDEAAVRSGLAQLLIDPELGRALIFEVDAEIAGYAVVTWGWDLEYGGRDAYLTDFLIVATFRGRGLSKLALQAVEEQARADGVQQLHLMVRPANVPARRLYEGAGFTSLPRVFLSKPLR